jgi:hypothetical protein
MDSRLETLRDALHADDSLEVSPPASEAALAAFEALHRIALPAAYRRFVGEVADGIGADGEPALYSLEQVSRELAAQSIDPTQSFPYSNADTAALNPAIAAASRDTGILGDPQVMSRQRAGTPAGCLPVAVGDGNDFPVLVVTGEQTGSMWHTGEVDVPRSADFVSWFEAWAPDILGLRRGT